MKKKLKGISPWPEVSSPPHIRIKGVPWTWRTNGRGWTEILVANIGVSKSCSLSVYSRPGRATCCFINTVVNNYFSHSAIQSFSYTNCWANATYRTHYALISQVFFGINCLYGYPKSQMTGPKITVTIKGFFLVVKIHQGGCPTN